MGYSSNVTKNFNSVQERLIFDNGQTTESNQNFQRIEYLSNYIQEIQNDLKTGNINGGTMQQKRLWLNQALEMLHEEFPESSRWDPIENADGEVDSANQVTNERAGDSPTGEENSSPVYDGKDFSIYPIAEGTNRKTIVRASGTVTLNPNSNSEYFKVEYNDDNKNYLVHVYSSKTNWENGVEKETIEVDSELIDHLDLEIDPSRIEFVGELKGRDQHTLNTGGNGKKIAATLQDIDPAGEALVDGDTAITHVETVEGEPIANYIGTAVAPDINLHPNFDDSISHHKIITSGIITLTPTSVADKVEVNYDSSKMEYKISIHKNGGDPTETFTVDAKLGSKIVIQTTDSQVDWQGVLADSKNPNNLLSILRGKITIGHEPAAADWAIRMKSFLPGSYSAEEAQTFADKIAEATKTGQWDDAKNYLTSLSGDIANNVVRKIITGMILAGGGSNGVGDPKAHEMLKQIPKEMIQIMKDKVLQEVGEWGESHGGDIGNSLWAARVITDSEAL